MMIFSFNDQVKIISSYRFFPVEDRNTFLGFKGDLSYIQLSDQGTMINFLTETRAKSIMNFKHRFHNAKRQIWIHHIRPGEFSCLIRTIRFIGHYL
jgi:hypothetical protein